MATGNTDGGRRLRATLAAGLVAAVVEMAFVLPIQGVMGNSPAVVFQSIAAGALGRAAFADGVPAIALGVAVHLLVSFVAAGLFVLATDRIPVLLRRPVVTGILYGAPIYVVMTFVVVPLSRIGFTPPKSLLLFSLSFGVHLFAFGLPIALTARAMLKPQPALAMAA